MLICLPFCAKDGELALKNLEWIRELDPKLPYHCLLSWDTETPLPMIRDMKLISESVFPEVTPNFYPAPEKRHWPAAANWAWQCAARYIAHFFPTESWLFLEADATPIRSGWLQQLEAEHIKGGKPITAHIVDGMGHPNGVAIYPALIAAFSQDAMRVEETAWDVVLGATVDKAMIHSANDIIRHCWNMDEKTGECTNGHGISPTFKSVHEVVRKVDLNASLYHRCKDGSLIHWLREHYKAPHKAFVPDHTGQEYEETKSMAERSDTGGVLDALSEDQKSVEIAKNQELDKTSNGVTYEESKHTQSDAIPNGDGVSGPIPEEQSVSENVPNVSLEQPDKETTKTEIFIVTYGQPTKRPSNLIVSDFDWLTWCLRAIRRHCTGFTGITLAIPDRDAALLQPIAAEHAQSKSGIPLKIKMFSEPPGKGFLMHEIVMASAEQFVPKDTEFVLHVDADVIFKEPITPVEYVHGNKPVYVVRSYESLAEVRNGQKVVSDCIQWLEPTKLQLGFDPVIYSMCRHPTAFPISFYEPYRKHIEGVHGKPFMEYMLSGRGSHPANRMDFTAMGAWAFKLMHDSFDWIDISAGNHLAPRDKQACFWSHGGLTPTIETEIKSFLA